MKRTLEISVSKSPKEHGVVTCQTVSMRERLLRFFLGNDAKLMVIVPSESVSAFSK